MNSYRHRSFQAPHPFAGASAWPGRVALAALIALALLALGTVAAPGRARAGSSGPKITYTSPIYTGQNNGFAEGPVGTQVNVQGSGWTPNTNVNITVADMAGDASGPPGSACTNGSTLYTAETTSADGSGNLTATFLWPTAANIKGHSYWACGDQGGAPSVGVDLFTVLSASPPSAQLNVTQAPAGGTVTISGQNWLPGGQQIGVILAPCFACEPGYGTNAQTTAKPDGTFSVSIQVPNQASVGTKLYASVQNLGSNQPGSLHTEPTNIPTMTVIAQATATPTPTNTPTASPTDTATASSGATNGAGGNGNGSGGSGGSPNNSGGGGLLIVLLSALGVVLLLAAVVAVLLFLRSRGPAPGTLGAGGPGGYSSGGGYSQYNTPRRTGAPPPTNPRYPETNIDYYGGPPRRPGQGGGWHSNPQGPDDGFGDAPTVGPDQPWR